MKIKYNSILKVEMAEFLNYRNSQGLNYEETARILKRLDNFLIENNINSKEFNTSFMDKFQLELSKTLSINSRCAYNSPLRHFSKYLYQRGIKFPIAENPIFKSNFKAYVFSKEEVNDFIWKCDELYENTKELRYAKYSVLLRIVYSCGLRISEVLNLKRVELDLINGTIFIPESKNDKERLVPFKDNLKIILNGYIENIVKDDEYLFTKNRNGKKHYSVRWAQIFFEEISRSLEIDTVLKDSNSPKGNNIHSLRHTFAVHSLQETIDKQEDPYIFLPFLSYYMGHENILGTEKYIHLAKENSTYINEKMAHYNNAIFPEVNFDEEN